MSPGRPTGPGEEVTRWQAAGPAEGSPGQASVAGGRLGVVALALIGFSLAGFAALMALGPSVAAPGIGTGGPFVWANARPSDGLAIALVRLASLAGATGTMLGLAAARRGWRPSHRLLAGTGVIAVIGFAFLPPAGSTDVLNYASYGRIASLGHSPYVMTPAQLRSASDPVGLLTPRAWRASPTVYGPVATLTQWAAAELGGASMAAIVFWIRLGNALAFLVTTAALLRLAGEDQTRRLRINLLWTANPLMAFWLVGSGHVDALLALLTAAALIAIRPAMAGSAGQHREAAPRRALIAGGLVSGVLAGAAIAIKLPYVIVAAGLFWPLRRSVAIIAAALGAVATFGVSYLLPGAAGTSAMSHRIAVGSSFIFYLPQALAARPVLLGALVLVAMAGVAALLARAMPPDSSQARGVRLMLALTVASLVVLPVQAPWYDALIFVLLPLLPASGLDYLLVARCLLLAELVLPGARPDTGAWSIAAGRFAHAGVFVMLAALIAGSLRGAWRAQPATAAR